MPPLSEDKLCSDSSLTMEVLQSSKQEPLSEQMRNAISDRLQRIRFGQQMDRDSSNHRRVRFASHEEVIEIRHVNDLTDEDIYNIWESRHNLKRIRKQCQLLVDMIEKQDYSFKGDLVYGHPIRGLEGYTTASNEKKKKLQNLMYETIHTIQAYNQQMDVADLLAHLCSKFSSLSVQAALEIAKSDHQAVYDDAV
jgi:hypothetical protein